MKAGEEYLIAGLTDKGKSYLASAKGHQACLNGIKVAYLTLKSYLPNLKNQMQMEQIIIV